MRVLIISQYFAPEITAAPMRIRHLAAGLAKRGHQIEVICQVPNHPLGRVHPGYGGKLVDRRDFDGLVAKYVWTYASPGREPWRRLASYASFAAASLAAGAVSRCPDVILASSPPLSVGLVGMLLAKRFRVPWVMDVRDLWPEVAGALGQVSPGRLMQTALKVEALLYRDAAAVTTVTQHFVDHIAEIRGRGGVHLIPNGTSDEWIEAAKINPSRAELGLPEGGFLLTYAGNVGLSQGVDVAVRAIGELGEGFNLLILGGGASRPGLEELADRIAPGRVLFMDPKPADEARRYLRASDALLVSLSDSPALAKTIPIKLYDYCAVGRPVIVSAPGEAMRVAEENDIAITSRPQDSEELARAVRQLAAGGQRVEAMIERAADFAVRSHRDQQIEPLERLLAGIVEER